MPRRPLIRHAVVPLALMLSAGCGSASGAMTLGAPSLTPTPVSPRAGEPQGGADACRLALDGRWCGKIWLAEDARYCFRTIGQVECFGSPDPYRNREHPIADPPEVSAPTPPAPPRPLVPSNGVTAPRAPAAPQPAAPAPVRLLPPQSS